MQFKIKYLLFLFVGACMLIVYQINYQVALSNSFGAPFTAGRGYTNSPFDRRTCNESPGCHVGSTFNTGPGTPSITTDIPADGYRGGVTYNITTSIAHNGINRFGFQLTSENGSDNKAGTFIAGFETRAQSDFYITQSIDASSSRGTNSRSWSFRWVAPKVGTGDVTFYGAFNAANGNGFRTGDNIYTTTITVSESVFSGTDELHFLNHFSVYPNPANEQVSLEFELKSPEKEITLQLFSMDGNMISQKRINNVWQHKETLEVHNLPSGMYFVQLSSDNYSFQKKIVVQ